MLEKLQEKMFSFSCVLELIISAVIAVSVIILAARLAVDAFRLPLWGEMGVLTGILDRAMTLAIGIEFIKMLCNHTPETVIEVLLFAIARQLVVVHTTPLENLLTVVAIAGLFAVRRFLLHKDDPHILSIRKKRREEKNEESQA